MIILAYAGVSLHTFRYTGAVMAKPYELGQYCEFAAICKSCRCKNCHQVNKYHYGNYSYPDKKCEDFSPRSGHPLHYWYALGVASVWPVWYTYRGYRRATVDMVGPAFFKEPKPIMSKEDRIKAQDKYIAELEKEVGIK